MNDDGVLIAEVAHIEAASAGGPRRNPLQSDEERGAAQNLLVLCHAHHVEVDDTSRYAYTVDELREMKRVHESAGDVATVREETIRQVLGGEREAELRAQFEYARSRFIAGERPEGDRELDRLVTRAEAHQECYWIARARLYQLWRTFHGKRPESTHSLYRSCHELLRDYPDAPEWMPLSLIRARARMLAMDGDFSDAANVLFPLTARRLDSETPEVNYEVLEARVASAFLAAAMGDFDGVDRWLRQVSEDLGRSEVSARELRGIRSEIDELRLQRAVQVGNQDEVQRYVDVLVPVRDPDQADDAASVLLKSANLARRWKQFRCGAICARGAAACARLASLPELVLACDYTEATLLCMDGETERGLRLATQIAERAEGGGHSRIAGACRLLAADAALQELDAASAIALASAARRNVAGDEDGEFSALRCLAEGHWLAGNADTAVSHWEEAARLAERAGAPPEEIGEILDRAANAVGQCGRWKDVASLLATWQASLATANDAGTTTKLDAAIARTEVYRVIRGAYATVASAGTRPVADSRSLREEVSGLLRPILEQWDDCGGCSPMQIDYWGRGSFIRLLEVLGSARGALTLVVEAHDLATFERAIRTVGWLADFTLILWKGKCFEGMALTAAPLDDEGAGGAGYILAAGTEIVMPGQKGTWCPAFGWVRFLPEELVQSLGGECRRWLESGRLMVVPAWSIACVNPGFGPMEQLLAKTIGGLPVAHQRNASVLPWREMPWFPDAPLALLGEVAEDPRFDRPALRRLLMKRAREFAASPGSYTDRELEQEIQEELAGLRDAVSAHERRSGWSAGDVPITTARVQTHPLEGVAARSAWTPFLTLGSAGHGWQVTSLADPGAKGGGRPPRFSSGRVGEWLAPPGLGPAVPVFMRPDR